MHFFIRIQRLLISPKPVVIRNIVYLTFGYVSFPTVTDSFRVSLVIDKGSALMIGTKCTSKVPPVKLDTEVPMGTNVQVFFIQDIFGVACL